ncbi:hypothetical protein HDU76_010807, partial [Blyttiomyces sp. JEL0837]
LGKGYGRYLYQVLKWAKVKKIAIITDDDPLDLSGAADAVEFLISQGVQVLTKIYLSYDTILAHNYEEHYMTLKNSDASSYGLIGPRYVWLGWNFPWPEPNYSGNVTAEFGPFATDPIQGYITDMPADQRLDAEPIQRFNNSWNALAAGNPRYMPTNNVFGGAALPMAPYDCTNLLLYGMDKLLKENPQFTPEMLANGSLKQYLNYTAFQNTGYNGIMRSPLTLNEYGDSQL